MEKQLSSIKQSLAIITIVLIMYVLHILAIIVVPLAFGLFFALLFTPLMRWFVQHKIPAMIGVLVVLLIVGLSFLGGYKIIELSSQELTSVDDKFIANMNTRVNEIIEPITIILKIEPEDDETYLSALLNNEKVITNVFDKVGSGLNMAKDLLTMLLMSLFFMILFLVGSVKISKVLELFVFKQKEASDQAYRQIEKDVFAFIMVKISMSLLTGIGVSLICYSFGVSFPIFWGMVAFLLNFVQLIGSVVVVVALLFFALIELNFTGTFLFFAVLAIGLQVVVGSILEPILMGKSFSINTITILVMLSIWGVVLGIPGLILSVPITALIKKIIEQFPSTKPYAEIMS